MQETVLDEDQIVEGHPEGKGVFAISDIDRGKYVCNYSRVILNHNYCEKQLLPFEEKCTCRGAIG